MYSLSTKLELNVMRPFDYVRTSGRRFLAFKLPPYSKLKKNLTHHMNKKPKKSILHNLLFEFLFSEFGGKQ